MKDLCCSLWLALGVLVGGCSYFVDTSVEQCATSADCMARGGEFAHTVCSSQHVCVKGPDCSSNLDCKDAHAGEPSICRRPDQTCVQLASPDCVVKAEPGDIVNDQTLWFGLVSPRMTAPHMEASANLVRQQIVKAGNLPPSVLNGLSRPMAFVSCTNDGGALPKVMDHLVKNLHVPAILGSNLSGDIVTMLTNYTTREGILTISPTASAANISDIPNGGLFFRTAGSDVIAVKTLAQVLRTVVEPQFRTAVPVVLGADEPMKVAVMYRGDALGISSVSIANAVISFNGKSASDNGARYKTINYGDPADPTNAAPAARYAAAVADVIAFQPHVIFVFGSLEFSNMDREIERMWPSALPYRPFYLVVKAMAKVFGDDIGTDEGWAKRVLGAQPYFDKTTPSYRAYEQFYKDTYPQFASSVGVAATPAYFDATYVLAYGVVANGSRPITGANLADAIRNRLTPPGRKIFVGYDRIFEVLSALGNGERVDLQGITGSIDFLPNGDVPQTQEVFCMRTDGTGTGPAFGKVLGAKSSGMIFDPDRDAIVGTIANCPGP